MDTPEAHYRVSIKGVYRNDANKYMLSKKAWKRWLAWWWIDHWETYQEALIREIKEELWLTVISISNKPTFFLTRFTKWGRHIANVMVDMDISSTEEYKPSDESDEIWFYSIEELVEMKEMMRPRTYEWVKSLV